MLLTRASSPFGPAAVVAGASLAMLAVPQVPRIQLARTACAGTTGHHTLLKRGEGATPATAAGVDHAPWPIGYGGSLANIDHNANRERKQTESGADHGHGHPPNVGRPPSQHPTGPIIPNEVPPARPARGRLHRPTAGASRRIRCTDGPQLGDIG